MREIKFRAWDLVTKTIQEVPNIFYNCGEKLTMVNMVTNRRFEFMQFTGLKDSKGKEIYEGDIVKWGRKGWKAIVEWHNFGLTFAWKDNEGKEIIGNIYENPELLKEVEND